MVIELQPPRPILIIVSGTAGSGKTTLAHRLATTIGCPALCRDELKEGMAISSPGFVPGPSDPLTLKTYDLFFAVIRLLLEWLKRTNKSCDCLQIGVVAVRGVDIEGRCVELDRLERALHAEVAGVIVRCSVGVSRAPLCSPRLC